MPNIKRLIVCFFLSFTIFTGAVELTGCKTPPTASTVAYTTLDAVGASVDAAMRTAATLRAQNKITAEQWQSVADIHAKYLVSFNAAVDAAAVAVDSAQVPANVAALANSIVNLVATFK